MEPINLMSCVGCQRIVDQFTFPIKCPRCGTHFHKAVRPTKWTITKWVFTHPKHVLKLLMTDIREKYHDKKTS